MHLLSVVKRIKACVMNMNDEIIITIITHTTPCNLIIYPSILIVKNCAYEHNNVYIKIFVREAFSKRKEKKNGSGTTYLNFFRTRFIWIKYRVLGQCIIIYLIWIISEVVWFDLATITFILKPLRVLTSFNGGLRINRIIYCPFGKVYMYIISLNVFIFRNI